MREIVRAKNAPEIARALADAAASIVGGEGSVSIRRDAELITPGRSQSQPYTPGIADSFIEHTVDGYVLSVWLSSDETVEGRLEVRSTGPIDQSDLETVEVLAAVAGVALARASAVTRTSELGRRESEFIDRFAHDVKTPLTSILGLAQTLRRRDRLSPELQDEFIERIEAASHTLERIVDEGRAQLKLAAEIVHLEPEFCDVAAVIKDAARGGQDGVQINLSIDSAVGEMSTDPSSLADAISCVVSHGSARAKGRVDVSASLANESLQIDVTDDGAPGDPETYDDSLWYQRDPGGIGRPPGDPLELIDAARLAKILGGDLTFVFDGGQMTMRLLIPPTPPSPEE